MSQGGDATVEQCGPREAWDALEANPKAQLVDVRSRPEWSFVGVPDMGPLGRQTAMVEWRSFPGMQVNPAFIDELETHFDPATASQVFFICRSGARSMEAAQTVAAHYAAAGTPVRCVNVAEGFEGDLDAQRHRGNLNGWKKRGLAWRQS